MSQEKKHPMLTCKELVTHLNDPEADTSLKKRLAVRLHLLMCDHCSAYVKQLDILKKAIKSLLNKKADSVDAHKSQEVQEKVLERLKSIRRGN